MHAETMNFNYMVRKYPGKLLHSSILCYLQYIAKLRSSIFHLFCEMKETFNN